MVRSMLQHGEYVYLNNEYCSLRQPNRKHQLMPALVKLD